MSNTLDSALADLRQTTILLRLVLDKRGLIVHGEIVNLQGVVVSHFKGWRGLTRELKTWLAAQTTNDSNKIK